jgi:hypothetical protein
MTNAARRLLSTAFLLLVASAPAAHAQGLETVTTVPFEFSAGNTNLPRDRYRISPMPGQPGVFLIRGMRQGVVLMSRVDRWNGRNPSPSLTFRRYGDAYFLREVELADGTILVLAPTRAERNAEERASAGGVAKSDVVVASRVTK